MSYFPGPIEIKDREGNTATLSHYDQFITGQRHDQILIKFNYSNSTHDVASTVTGNGATTNAASMAIISSGTDIGTAELKSLRMVSYRPAHEIYTYFTALFSGNQDANTYQSIGLFDDVCGFWVGYSGTSFGISRRNASTDNFVASASFSEDPLNGTGNSGFTLDPSKLNQYKITYGWLGIGPIVFSVYGGQTIGWIPFHIIDLGNSQTTVSISDPSSFFTAQAGRTSGTGSAVSLSTASWAAGTVEQAHAHAGHRVFAGSASKTLVAATETYIATFQNKSTYQGKTNKVLTYAVFFGASTDGTKNVLIQFKKDCSLTTPTFNDIDTANSIMAIDTTAAAFSGGTLELPVPMAKVDQIIFDIGIGHIHLELLPGEVMTITGTSSAASDVQVAFRWEEFFS